jgi:hypothetical protein
MVNLKLGSLSAALAGEPVPSQHLSPDGGPVAWTAQVPNRGVLPGPPGLVLSTPTVPDGLGGAAGSQANAFGPGHGHLQVFGPGWVLIWQPGPTTFLDLYLEPVSRAFKGSAPINKEINKKET